MDINRISLFPQTFLKKLLDNNDIGCFFMHINDERYHHMMARMMLILLGNENFTPELVQSLHDRHANMKLTRKEYKLFMEIFNDTLNELGFPQDQIRNINLRIKTLILQIQNVRHNKHKDMLQSLINMIKDTVDLNIIRTALIADLHTLQDMSYNSDIIVGLQKSDSGCQECMKTDDV